MIGCGATVRWKIAANAPGPRGRSGTVGYRHLPTENGMANAKSTAGTASKAGSAGDAGKAKQPNTFTIDDAVKMMHDTASGGG